MAFVHTRKESVKHSSIIRIRLIDGKIRIQYDGTEEYVATEFLEAGVLKEQIVLEFRDLNKRKHSGLAVE